MAQQRCNEDHVHGLQSQRKADSWWNRNMHPTFLLACNYGKCSDEAPLEEYSRIMKKGQKSSLQGSDFRQF